MKLPRAGLVAGAHNNGDSNGLIGVAGFQLSALLFSCQLAVQQSGHQQMALQRVLPFRGPVGLPLLGNTASIHSPIRP
jgi:hypothetical protein